MPGQTKYYINIYHAVVQRMNLIPLNISRAGMSCVFTTFTNLNETGEEEPHCQIFKENGPNFQSLPTQIFL